ncbi:hypothetical protein, partial [Allocoleopsis sp.]|uniref:hypothetical protein n=1 Tax=Allocoleopsis sp. TaxID=3088169 RepID=UPI002FCFCBB0
MTLPVECAIADLNFGEGRLSVGAGLGKKIDNQPITEHQNPPFPSRIQARPGFVSKLFVKVKD